MIEIKTLKGVSFDQIEDVFNLSFSEYYFKIYFSKKQLEDKFSSENGILELSVGAFENNKLVGFILHFYAIENNEKAIYNGGTGVIPSKRGQSLALKMFDYIMPVFRKNKIDKMALEVLTINKPAIRVYESLGFKQKRTLNCYNGKLAVTTEESEYTIQELKNYDWPQLQSFWDHQPTWQNSILTLNNLKPVNTSKGIYLKDTLVGYIIFNPTEKRIHQIAIDKNHRKKGLGSKLLNEVSRESKEKISFINIDDRILNFGHFLEKHGMQKFTQQYEMELIMNDID